MEQPSPAASQVTKQQEIKAPKARTAHSCKKIHNSIYLGSSHQTMTTMYRTPLRFGTRYLSTFNTLASESATYRARLAAPVSWDYVTRDGDSRVNCTVRIHPALLEDRDKQTLAYFPGSTEEVIEETLKKFYSTNN